MWEGCLEAKDWRGADELVEVVRVLLLEMGYMEEVRLDCVRGYAREMVDESVGN